MENDNLNPNPIRKAAVGFPFSLREIRFLAILAGAFFLWDWAIIQAACWCHDSALIAFPRLQVQLLEALILGSMLAQVVIVAIWAAYAEGWTLLRVLVAALILTLASIAMGKITSTSWCYYSSLLVDSAGWLVLFLLFKMLLIPFTLLRKLRGWRLVYQARAAEQTVSRVQVQVSEMLGYTTVVAMLTVLTTMTADVAFGHGLVAILVVPPICAGVGLLFLRKLEPGALLTLFSISLYVFWIPVLTLAFAIQATFLFGLSFGMAREAFVPVGAALVAGATFGMATLISARNHGLRFLSNRLLSHQGEQPVLADAESTHSGSQLTGLANTGSG